MDIVLDKKRCHFMRKVDGTSIKSHGSDLMMVAVVQVDNVGDCEYVGECRILFDEEMFEISCT